MRGRPDHDHLRRMSYLHPCTRGENGTPCGNVPGEGEKFKTGHPDKGAHCFRCWRAKVAPKKQSPRVAAVLVRPVRCLHLATRLEFKHGCNGMKCRHECGLGLPAVPGVYCQTCERYEADAGAWV